MSWLNVIEAGAADINGDGFTDLLLEVRAGDGAGNAHSYAPYQYRDISPGVPMIGTILWVDGSTGRTHQLAAQRASVGPGPMSTAFSNGDHTRVAVMSNAQGGEASQSATVTAYEHGQATWTRHVPVDPGAWQALGTPYGPVFVTVTPTSPLNTPALLVNHAKVIALAGKDGHTLFQRDFVINNGFQVRNMGGDLVIDNEQFGTLERVDGLTGRTKWQATYAWTPRSYGVPAGDATGDGVPDFLLVHTAGGALLVSGAEGQTSSRVLYESGVDLVFPVGDLNGDGSSDVVTVPGASEAVGVFVTASGPVVAFDGRTGLPLWAAQLPLSSASVEVASAQLDAIPGEDLVIRDFTGNVIAFDGRSGRMLWSTVL